jgi:hypothetical protein
MKNATQNGEKKVNESDCFLTQDKDGHLAIRNAKGMLAAFSALMPGDMPLVFPVAFGPRAAMESEIETRRAFWKAKEAARASILAASRGGEGKDSGAMGQTRQIAKQGQP